MKPSRHRSREEALQILYQWDLNQDLTVETAIDFFQKHFAHEKENKEFSRRLIEGVAQNLAELDKSVEESSQNWRASRMAAVDRNILRMGAFELLHCDDIPATVTINEMVELAKQFGSQESPAFINGILDNIKSKLNRPQKAP
jgi:N utilization substance protein B